MAISMEEICHEGTLPGKTLSRYLAVTPRYLLHSSSFTFWDSDVELVRAVALLDGRLYVSGLALQEADAIPVSIFIKDNPVSRLYHLANRAQHFTDVCYLKGHADQRALVSASRYDSLPMVTND